MKYALSTKLDEVQLDALWARATSGDPDVEIVYPPYEPALVGRWTYRARTDEQVLALDATCEKWSLDHLYESLSPEQLGTIKRARLSAGADGNQAAPSEDDALVARRRRFYFFMRTVISPEEWASVARVGLSQLWEPGYAVRSLRYPGLRQRVAAVAADLHDRVKLAFEERGQNAFFESTAHETAKLLWAATSPSPKDPLVKRAAMLISARKRDFVSMASRDDTAKTLGRVLLEAHDPLGTLEALRAGATDKNVLDVYVRVHARLVADLGRALDFGVMEPAEGAAFLLDDGDPRWIISRALLDADGERTLRIFAATAHHLPGRHQDMLGTDGWQWLERILIQLDRTLTTSVASDTFARAWLLGVAGLTKPRYASAPTTEVALVARLRALRDASRNAHFRALAGAVLKD